ncbi:MAG: DUF167 domain-containing protein [Polyangiaceae bacterium]|nr:DUF167 domain-containing protein [Polyangiaceae bacterium]
MSPKKPSDGVRVAVHVKPRAKTSRITGADGLSIQAAIAAPPVDGAANDALVAFIAEALGLPRRSVRLVGGTASKHKVVEVIDLPEAVIVERLAAAVS